MAKPPSSRQNIASASPEGRKLLDCKRTLQKMRERLLYTEMAEISRKDIIEMGYDLKDVLSIVDMQDKKVSQNFIKSTMGLVKNIQDARMQLAKAEQFARSKEDIKNTGITQRANNIRYLYDSLDICSDYLGEAISQFRI